MVHTNPDAANRFFAYYNLRREDRVRMSQVRDPSYEDRYRRFRRRGILAERGLDLSRIDDMRTVQIAEERGWQSYIQNPESYDAALVVEFYAAMLTPVFDEFSTVIVQGRTIRMTNDDIANFYQVPRHVELDATYGIPPIPGVEQDEEHSPIIASSLRRSGNARWEVRKAEIQKSELEPGLGLWLLFVKGCLAPSSHYTTLNPYVARIMYCIQHSMPLDVGFIIRLHMIDAAADNCTGILPFPCLITQFCRDAGIEIGRTTPAFAPYNRQTYRAQITAANRRDDKATLASERMHIPQGADDEDVDDVDYDPGVEAGHQPLSFDPQLHSRLDTMERTWNSGFGAMMRGFRYLGVPEEELAEPNEAGSSNPPRAQRARRSQPGASSSRNQAGAGPSTRRRNRD